MGLYSDFTYRQKAEAMKKQMEGLRPDSEEYAAAKKLFDAYVGNIRNEVLKIK